MIIRELEFFVLTTPNKHLQILCFINREHKTFPSSKEVKRMNPFLTKIASEDSVIFVLNYKNSIISVLHALEECLHAHPVSAGGK